MLALLVVNPQATATTAAGQEVLARALASTLKLDIVQTAYRGHAQDAAAQAAADGVDLVVAHGGDGTVNEVVNGLLTGAGGGRAPALGVVPGGSANVFARALGLPRDPVDATGHLLGAIEAGRRRSVGLGLADDRWFTFSAGVGWDADVVAGVDRKRTKQASPALYVRTALATYVREAFGGPELTVQIDDDEPVHGLRMTFLSNTDPWTYLGNRPVRPNPGCTFDSGIGLFALRSVRVPTVARHLSQILRGKGDPHGKNLLRCDDAARVLVTSQRPVRLQVDGDLVGERTSVEFLSVPRALDVAV